MRLLLQQTPRGDLPALYVQLTLQADLLGGWELLRESGQIGGRVQLRRDQFLDADTARSAFEKARDSQLKRGFHPIPPSGADASP